MSIGGIIGVIVGSIVVFILLILAVSYVKAPPDTAIIITGPRKQRVLIGKAGFRWPFIQRIDKLPLNLIQVDIKTPDAVPTSEFINIFVDGVANIKIGNTPDDCRVPNYFIKVFANCFMKKSADCTTYMQKVPLARNFFD